jgi:WD40 repeat protein
MAATGFTKRCWPDSRRNVDRNRHSAPGISTKRSKNEPVSISFLLKNNPGGNCKPCGRDGTGAGCAHRLRESGIESREAIQLLEYDIFCPNKSNTHAIISIKPVAGDIGSGMIVDIVKKEAFSPFHGNKVRMFEWSPNGKFVAYSVDHSRWIPSAGKHLVIYDVENRKIVLEKGLGDYIASMAWSPDSDHIAVLIRDTRIFSVDPNEQRAFLAGHPEGHDSFSLKIFDLKREIKSIDTFGKGVNAKGTMLWQ